MSRTLHYWLYASRSAITANADAEVERIVAQSRRNNARMEISGAMIYGGDRFAQYIEGPSAAISALRETVTADPRHCDIVILDEGTLTERRFPEWSLGYAGPSFFMERSILLAQAPGEASHDDRDRLMRMLEEFGRQRVRPAMPPVGS